MWNRGFLLLFAFCSFSFAQVLYFNPKEEGRCISLPPTCFFNDSSIWIPALQPNNTTSLIVNSSAFVQVVLLQQLSVQSLTISGNASVTIEGDLSTANSGNFSFLMLDNSTLQIIKSGVVTTSLLQSGASTLILSDNATLYAYNYNTSLQANVFMYGGQVSGQNEFYLQFDSFVVIAGSFGYEVNANYVYVGASASTGSIAVRTEGYLYGLAGFSFYAGPNSVVYLFEYSPAELEIGDGASVFWRTGEISVGDYMDIATTGTLYVEATGIGEFCILCGEYGNTVVENAQESDKTIRLFCGKYPPNSVPGELVLYGNYIIYAINYFTPTTLKVDGQATIFVEDMIIGPNSNIPNYNVSVFIPSGGNLVFQYGNFSGVFSWLNWTTNSALIFEEVNIFNFGQSFTIDDLRSVIFALPKNWKNILVTTVEVDNLFVSNTSKLWFQSGTQTRFTGNVDCEGTLDLTSPTYFSTILGIPYPTNVTINGNLTLDNSSFVNIPQEALSGNPFGVGFIEVLGNAYLSGTLNVTIGGDLYAKFPTGVDMPILRASNIYYDFQDFMVTILQPPTFHLNASYRIQDNIVIVHMEGNT